MKYLNGIPGHGDKNFHYGKSNEPESKKQEVISIYKDIANPEAVKTEIGDVIKVFNEEIKISKKEVLERRDLNPIKYQQRGFYSQDLNATIKERLIKRMESDPDFSKSIRIRNNSGSSYFIIKDKYVLYVKRLYGKSNKPHSYPTPKSDKLFNGTLFLGESRHIPILFIGPNLGNIAQSDAFVTSLISKYEVNWSAECSSLFSAPSIITLKAQPEVVEEKEVVKLKKGLGKQDKKHKKN